MEYSYRYFSLDRDPRREVGREEYVAMKRNLNYFMHKMLKQLHTDEEILGKDAPFRPLRLLFFIVLTLGAVAGMIFLEHPAAIAFSGFLSIILGMSIVAVPVTFWTDRRQLRKQRQQFISEVKSFYMFQHSLLYKTADYEEYVDRIPGASLDKFEKYLDKYA